jgi:hypothetical protein
MILNTIKNAPVIRTRINHKLCKSCEYVDIYEKICKALILKEI